MGIELASLMGSPTKGKAKKLKPVDGTPGVFTDGMGFYTNENGDGPANVSAQEASKASGGKSETVQAKEGAPAKEAEAFQVEKGTGTGGWADQPQKTAEGNANNQLNELSKDEMANADDVYEKVASKLGVHSKEEFRTAWANMDPEERARWVKRAKAKE